MSHLTSRPQEQQTALQRQTAVNVHSNTNGNLVQEPLRAGTFPGKSLPPSQLSTTSAYAENLIMGAGKEFFSLRRESKNFDEFLNRHTHLHQIQQSPIVEHASTAPGRKSIPLNPEVRFFPDQMNHATSNHQRSTRHIHPQQIKSFLRFEREPRQNTHVSVFNGNSDRRLGGRTGYKLAPSEDTKYAANWMSRSNVG